MLCSLDILTEEKEKSIPHSSPCMPSVHKTAVRPHLPSGSSSSPDSTAPPLFRTPPPSIFVSLSPFVSVVPSPAHILSRSASCSPPLPDTHCPAAALFLPLFLFHLHHSVRSSSSLALHATFLGFHLLLARSRLSVASLIYLEAPRASSLSVCFLHFLVFDALFFFFKLPGELITTCSYWEYVFSEVLQERYFVDNCVVHLMACNFLLLLQNVAIFTSFSCYWNSVLSEPWLSYLHVNVGIIVTLRHFHLSVLPSNNLDQVQTFTSLHKCVDSASSSVKTFSH